MRSYTDTTNRLWRDSPTPLTNGFLGAMAALFLADFARLPLAYWIVCAVPRDLGQPWRLFTYGFEPGGIIGLLFGGLMLWWVGGSLERGWGSRTFAIFCATLSVITALSFVPIALYLSRIQGTAQPVEVPSYLVLAGLLVAWCMLNPDAVLNIYGIIPIKARYLAAGEVAVIFFTVASGFATASILMRCLLGLSSLIGCGFALAWVRSDWVFRLAPGRRSPWSGARRPPLRMVPPVKPKKAAREVPPDDRSAKRNLNPLAWLEEQKRRRKFERLMKDD